jgi:alpha-tubulin suppressor-like RCC1 family protein
MARRNLRRSRFALALAVVVALLALGHAPRPGFTTGTASVSAGNHHACIVTAAGGVLCWGENSFGQIGNGTMMNAPLPVDVTGLTSGVAQVSAGGAHTCALTMAGGVKCWGYNGYGQLGDGTATNRPTPVDVTGLSSNVTAMSAGSNHTCALMTGGGVKCWGLNGFGQLGNGSMMNSPTPVDVAGLTAGVAAVSAGQLSHSCALTTGGGVKCWGANSNGQLGDDSTAQSSTPVDVSGLANGVAAISTGAMHTCALTTGGGAKCWGDNAFGQLGDGTTDDRDTPVDVSGLTSGVAAVSNGYYHTCALTPGGGAMCWGDNTQGQLGNSSVGGQSETPAAVSGLTSGVGSIAAGSVYDTCALSTAGIVSCWGGNAVGQLGIGTTSPPIATPAGVRIDFDRDGCLDSAESQKAAGSELTGGWRNPKSFWDFMDQYTGSPLARDRAVAIGDIGAVVARFGANGDPDGDPLETPVATTGYHVIADRSGSYPGEPVWSLQPPNGTITVGDIGAAVGQFGHSCA